MSWLSFWSSKSFNRPSSRAGGARTHVLGIITAFEKLGWDVIQYIVGDQVPRKWVTKDLKKVVSTCLFHKLVVDLIHLIFLLCTLEKPGKSWKKWTVYTSVAELFKLWREDLNIMEFLGYKKLTYKSFFISQTPSRRITESFCLFLKYLLSLINIRILKIVSRKFNYSYLR